MSTASDARNLRARALGFSSYSQQYRARKAGHSSAASYQATTQARKGANLVRQTAAGKLLGGKYTTAGLVVSAWVYTGLGRGGKGIGGAQVSAQWQTITRQPDSAHVGIHVRTASGESQNLGGKGGYSVPFLRQLVRDNGSWINAVMALMAFAYGVSVEDLEPAIITVTIK